MGLRSLSPQELYTYVYVFHISTKFIEAQISGKEWVQIKVLQNEGTGIFCQKTLTVFDEEKYKGTQTLKILFYLWLSFVAKFVISFLPLVQILTSSNDIVLNKCKNPSG